MSSSINVYAVPVARLKQVVGSRDSVLIKAIVVCHDYFFSRIDDIDDEAEKKCEDAIAELINGEIAENTPGYLYGYAIEAICSHIGEAMSNICPLSGASDWIAETDSILERKGIAIRLSELVYGGSPVRIPEPDDYPFIGHWKPLELEVSATAFQAADLTDLDQETVETLQQIRGWVVMAVKTPGTSVVGFLS